MSSVILTLLYFGGDKCGYRCRAKDVLSQQLVGVILIHTSSGWMLSVY